MLNNILTNKTHYGTKGPAIFYISTNMTKAAIANYEYRFYIEWTVGFPD